MTRYSSPILGRFDRALPPRGDDADEREAFALQLRSYLRLLGDGNPDFDARTFTLRFPGGRAVHLATLFDEVNRLPDRNAAIMELARRLSPREGGDLSPDPELARRQLRPRIVPHAHLALWLLQQAADGHPHERPPFIFRTLTDRLLVQLAYERPASYALLSPHHLDLWGIEPPRAFEQATRNVLALSRRSLVKVGTGTWEARTGDGLDAARLLLVEVMEQLAVIGEPVALAWHRDGLLVSGTEDRAGLAMMLAKATEALSRSGIVSVVPLVLRNGRWQDWLPGPDHPLHEPFAELRIHQDAALHAAQKELLERLRGPVAIAPYALLRHPADARLYSHSVWAAGPCLVPEVDYLSVPGPEGRRIALVPWEHAHAVCGDLFQRDPTAIPALWHVPAGPPADRWAALSEGAVVLQD